MQKIVKTNASALLGSSFLMATSAIGPGFITQTTVFTQQLLASFGFVILCSIILDIIVQLNIWRVVSVSGMHAQDLSNKYLSGSGYVLSLLIVLGGLAFNIGNIAGASLGMQVIAKIDREMGVALSVIIALFIFWYKEAGKAMDVFTRVLGLVMILLMTYIAIRSGPPVVEVLHKTVVPDVIDPTAIVILVGGTVGGYISFAGVHRLLDAGISGEQNISSVSRSSVRAILLASAMRILLFLAALGVVASGGILDPANPPASVFRIAAGEMGYRIFGVILWCASITSVVGSAYTSVSFLKTFHSFFEKNQKIIVTLFITISAIVFIMVGRPVNILIIVGALNAFILPFALAIILLVSRHSKFMGTFKHSAFLIVGGWITVILLSAMSINTIVKDLAKLW